MRTTSCGPAILLVLAASGCLCGDARLRELCPDGTPAVDGRCPENSCGNGTLEATELCDTAVASGSGGCPTEVTCRPSGECETAELVGAACQLRCARAPLDCDPDCGDGELDPGERCDPAIESGVGACPASCAPKGPCWRVAREGERCDVACVDERIGDLAEGDGCCPPRATHDLDSDCPAETTCGNGRLDSGEACDSAIRAGPGACPASCPPATACATTTLEGTACDARCVTTLAAAADGCCLGPKYGGDDADCSDPDVCAEPASTFDAQKLWDWDNAPLPLKASSVTGATPLVVQLSDDDGDGRIDARDVPDVFVVMAGILGLGPPPADPTVLSVFAALSGDTGRHLWVKDGTPLKVSPFTSPAAVDLDGDGVVELILAGLRSENSNLVVPELLAFEHDGTLRWRSTPIGNGTTADVLGAIHVADLEGDGEPEILLGNRVFDAFGRLKWQGPDEAPPPQGGRFGFAIELGGEPGLEVIDGGAAYTARGRPLWSRRELGFAQVTPADCDGDGEVELFLHSTEPGGPSVAIVNAAGTIVRGPTSLAALRPNSPAAAGDLDGDGRAEFVVGATTELLVIGCDLQVKARAGITDLSGAAGPVLFDFDGDGRSEIVFADELSVMVFAGDGRRLWSDTRLSRTGLETPVVADVNGDGEAELIVPQARLTTGVPAPAGVRVYRSRGSSWRGSAPIWHQHQFQALGVFDDGALAGHEGAWWRKFNGFRAARSLARPGTTCP